MPGAAPPGTGAPGARGGPPAGRGRPPTEPYSVTGGFLHRFPAALDPGHFRVTRFLVEPRARLVGGRRVALAVSGTWLHDRYDYSGGSDLGPGDPWEDIDSLGVGAFFRWSCSEGWNLFAIPILRFTAEGGGGLASGFEGGGIGGVSYRLGEDLSVGPGVGILSQIADRPSVFPVLFVAWKLAENLRVRTGSGIGASRGPGLTVEWTFAERWSLTLGGRYERRRFRLDDHGIAPDGVGEDESAAIVLDLGYEVAGRIDLSAFLGVNLLGKLHIDDRSGDRIDSASYGPAPFGGLLAAFRF